MMPQVVFTEPIARFNALQVKPPSAPKKNCATPAIYFNFSKLVKINIFVAS